MSDKRVTVWVQRFKDRPHLVLQWIDPETGARKSKSAKTADPKEADAARKDLEYELTHGKYQEASRMTWERFRELFEREYAAPLRFDTRRNYAAMFDLFERLCRPSRLRSISERSISTFASLLRQQKGIHGGMMQVGTIKVRLQFLHTALQWAADQKFITACPRFPVVKVPKRKPQPVPAEAFDKLLEKAPDDPMRAFLLCGWLAGLRLREAMNLDWEETDKAPWVDFSRNRIWLPAGFVKAVEDQWVPLDLRLREALEALPRQGRKVFRFVSRWGNPIKEVALGHRVTALARLAGVRLTMKSLRRGFGCRYAGKVSAQVLQKLMRHANITVTMDYYANVDQAVEEAVLGPQRNTLRNKGPIQEPEPVEASEPNPLEPTGYE
jgi:integrase